MLVDDLGYRWGFKKKYGSFQRAYSNRGVLCMDVLGLRLSNVRGSLFQVTP